MTAPNCWRCRTLPGTCLEHSSFLPVTAPVDIAAAVELARKVLAPKPMCRDCADMNPHGWCETRRAPCNPEPTLSLARALIALADARHDIEQQTAEAIALMLRREAKRAMAGHRPTGSDATRAGALAEVAVLVDNGTWRAP